MKKIVCVLAVAAALFWSAVAFAAHPLITDDAGTQGTGKYQFEFNSQYDHDSDHGVKSEASILNTTLTYGMNDKLDFAVGIPYLYTKSTADGTSDTESGIGDAGLSLKWRFFDRDGLSFAVKPGVTLATGDDEKGLGTGKTGYSMFFITTREARPWAFHVNLGYIRNENKTDERVDIWHGSLTAAYEIREGVKLVADAGFETNRERTSSAPGFFIAGLIYSLWENLDLDAGAKIGLDEVEVDYSLLAGVTLRF